MAPFSVVIVPMNYHKSETVRAAADQIYADLQAAGVEVLLDDRNERAGVLLADSELIGIPQRIVIGDRGLGNNQVEYQKRGENEAQAVSLNEIVNRVLQA